MINKNVVYMKLVRRLRNVLIVNERHFLVLIKTMQNGTKNHTAVEILYLYIRLIHPKQT